MSHTPTAPGPETSRVHAESEQAATTLRRSIGRLFVRHSRIPRPLAHLVSLGSVERPAFRVEQDGTYLFHEDGQQAGLDSRFTAVLRPEDGTDRYAIHAALEILDKIGLSQGYDLRSFGPIRLAPRMLTPRALQQLLWEIPDTSSGASLHGHAGGQNGDQNGIHLANALADEISDFTEWSAANVLAALRHYVGRPEIEITGRMLD